MAICGAKKRNGEACQKPPTKGKMRCRLHGGTANSGAPKGNKNSAKHNIYAQFMTDDEKKFSLDVDLDSIDAELRLCKVQLKRALEARAKQESDPENTLDLDTKVLGDVIPGVADSGDKTTYKRKDYDAFIDRTVARISALTKQRNELIDQQLTIKLKQAELSKIERENGQGGDSEVVIKVVRVGKDGVKSNTDGTTG